MLTLKIKKHKKYFLYIFLIKKYFYIIIIHLISIHTLKQLK